MELLARGGSISTEALLVLPSKALPSDSKPQALGRLPNYLERC